MSSEHPILDKFFPAEEIVQAVDACRKQDRRLDMYHKFAPPSAKPFIELGFYSTHFGDQVDPDLYAQCRDAIVPTLAEDDIRYLLRFETDPETKSFLESLLHELRKPKLRLRRRTAAPVEPTPAAAQSPAPAFPANPPPRLPNRPRRVRIVVDTNLLKLLALLALLGGIVLFIAEFVDFGIFKSEPQDQEPEDPAFAQASPGPGTQSTQTQKVVHARKPVRETSPAEKPAVSKIPVATNITEQTVADVPASNVVQQAAATQGKARDRKLVLTDGTSIRTRADGTIEVPRTFSYAGARLRKPFWIYDRQLEKSGRIEYEAQAEKAARDKWKALYDEAVRSANP